jgi:hypothetical protein
MTTFPRSPRVAKGAIVGMDPANPLASVIVFQHNPERMTRRLEARAAGGDGSARDDVLRLSGPPQETYTLSVEIDAADQLERADPITLVSGISPALSALEMLLYPKASTVRENLVRARLGEIEILPPKAPLTVLAWGPGRVVPVRLTGFSIEEQAYDPALNPILASVELSLTVLSTMDFAPEEAGFQLFLAHQIAKEVLATSNVAASAQSINASVGLF